METHLIGATWTFCDNLALPIGAGRRRRQISDASDCPNNRVIAGVQSLSIESIQRRPWIWPSTRAQWTAAWLLALCLALTSQVPAQQRAQDNAVTVADDAFGTAIGLQNVGLYSATDARGFNPQQAGNLRIEGLYFDQQTWVTSPCMVRETTMRIGIAAQAYSFPSPTGIADLSLRTPGDQWAFSGLASLGPFNGRTIQLEEQIPIIPKTLSADLCGGYYRNFNPDQNRQDGTADFGTTLRWRPGEKTEIIPFWSYLAGGGHQSLPAVYTDGTVPLPPFHERDLASQTWTTQAWRMTTLGTVVKSELTDRWHLAAGLFHSQEHDPWSFNPYLQLNANGTADSFIDVMPPLQASSTSGEVHLSGVATQDVHRHELEFAIRGRTVDHSYGGDDNLNFGNIDLQSQTQFVQPPIVLTQQSQDLTRELDVGATYEERWQGLGSAAIGLLKDNYRRTNEVPSVTPATFRTTPWLINLRLTLESGSSLLYYGSYTQGLEDSALAPVSAVNRGEPPAAARTWQVDGGIRYAPGERLRVILGVFDIHKPYLNLDAANVYRPLGRLYNEGLESSLSYSNAGLTLLAGGVWLRPRVDLTVMQPGATGSEPIGPVPLTLTANLDYAPPNWGPWAASLQWNRLSSRYSTSDDLQRLPPLATVGAGARYQWKLRENSWTLRFDGFNLINAQGLHVSALGLVLPEQSRHYALTLATDF
jgi:iron complex outermembrane recepter protein